MKYKFVGIICCKISFAAFFSLIIFFSTEIRSESFIEDSITIDSVSVLENNSIIIGWTLITDEQVGSVEVHRRLDSGLYGVITQVPLTQSYFIDTDVNAQNNGYSYYVVARYPNGDNIAVGNEAHQTIHLDELQADICGKTILLNWSNYSLSTTAGEPEPLPSPFEQNRISMSFNGGVFENLMTTPNEVEQMVFPADEPGEYCFHIQSFYNDPYTTSTSNVKCLDINFLPTPGFITIRSASVVDDAGNVQILAHADNSVPDPAYVFHRWHHEAEEFIVLDTIVTVEQTFTYEDTEAQASLQSEIYKISALDSCRVNVLESDVVATIFLSNQALSSYENQLQWNAYEGWDADVAHYSVLRKTDDLQGFEEIAIVPAGTTSYLDDLSFVNPDLLQGDVLYRLMAIEAEGNIWGFKDTVLSNTVKVDRDVQLFVPNAFRPSSQIAENRVFRPVFSFFTPASYSLVVFNKWGQEVYATNDINDAWDGRLEGRKAPAGVYAYVISYKNANGEDMEKRGAVLLVR